ncbi:MAG TPA: polyprenyl diphosphate synthase [Candidatus Sulfotelmatobacter sp.]|nr:polyprenyl diphosphate synthase [Candidatus Sulfotelmatobacter sp.]
MAVVRPDAAPTAEPRSDADAVPRHVAIIMDGNRRWARDRGLSEAEGHAAGVEAIRPIVRRATERGVEVLSLYAFSRENWSRPDPEVQTLLELMGRAIRDETPELRRSGARVRVLGRLDELPAGTQQAIRDAVAATAGGTRLTLNVAFNYSGRSELVDAARRCLEDGLRPDQIDEASLAARLYTSDLPEPDLVIRTGGDQRLSNFLIWQAAYAEFYFCDTFWPDFDSPALDTALADFATRSRRFGR